MPGGTDRRRRRGFKPELSLVVPLPRVRPCVAKPLCWPGRLLVSIAAPSPAAPGRTAQVRLSAARVQLRPGGRCRRRRFAGHGQPSTAPPARPLRRRPNARLLLAARPAVMSPCTWLKALLVLTALVMAPLAAAAQSNDTAAECLTEIESAVEVGGCSAVACPDSCIEALGQVCRATGAPVLMTASARQLRRCASAIPDAAASHRPSPPALADPDLLRVQCNQLHGGSADHKRSTRVGEQLGQPAGRHQCLQPAKGVQCELYRVSSLPLGHRSLGPRARDRGRSSVALAPASWTLLPLPPCRSVQHFDTSASTTTIVKYLIGICLGAVLMRCAPPARLAQFAPCCAALWCAAVRRWGRAPVSASFACHLGPAAASSSSF